MLHIPDWNAPENWTRIQTIDCHTEGEPLRVIIGGYPEIPGRTIMERRNYCRTKLDHLRKALMWEPRGHADMYGAILTPSERHGSDFGVIFMHNDGYSSMCGHGIIGVTRIAIETGLIKACEPVTEIRIDTPAGLVIAFARMDAGKVVQIFFHNVPSYVVELDAEIDVDGVGKVNYDLAFGGAFYAYVDAESLNLELAPAYSRDLIRIGAAIKEQIAREREIRHPYDPHLGFLYGTIFTGPPEDPSHHSRNVCIFAAGELDRSPTGTGVSGNAAILIERGRISVDETIVIESILGTTFTVTPVGQTDFGDYNAIIPAVSGRAHITGKNEFFIDPDDPIGNGFFIR